MPIEIRELVIRAHINPHDTSSTGSHPSSNGSSISTSDDRTEIIQACVQEVLRILEDKQER